MEMTAIHPPDYLSGSTGSSGFTYDGVLSACSQCSSERPRGCLCVQGSFQRSGSLVKQGYRPAAHWLRKRWPSPEGTGYTASERGGSPALCASQLCGRHRRLRGERRWLVCFTCALSIQSDAKHCFMFRSRLCFFPLQHLFPLPLPYWIFGFSYWLVLLFTYKGNKPFDLYCKCFSQVTIVV